MRILFTPVVAGLANNARKLTPEQAMWGAVGMAVVMLIAWLNDLTKPAERRAKDAANPNAINGFGSALLFFIGLLALLAVEFKFGEGFAKRLVRVIVVLSDV